VLLSKDKNRLKGKREVTITLQRSRVLCLLCLFEEVFMKYSSRLLLALSALFLLGNLAFIGALQAQDFPNKPITLVSPYPANGMAEAIAKLVGKPLEERLKQTVLIENLSGASGTTAVQKVLDAPSDGYTLLQATPSELVLVPFANKNVKFKSEDFRMLQFVANTPLVIVARKGLEANNADELAVLARRAAALNRPLVYASMGQNSFNHILGNHLSKRINAPMLHAPYRGASDMLKGLSQEQIDIIVVPYDHSIIALHTSGQVKFIAALSAQRQPALPDVPAVDEGVALKGCYQSLWFAYFVKKDTPEPIVQVLHKALSQTLGNPTMSTALVSKSSIVPPPLSLADANKKYAAEIIKFRAMAKSMSLDPR
jgi:tripartite-type tricarboxylate transporter receptor subunit TctC